MPEISLQRPNVLRELIKAAPYPENYIMLNQVEHRHNSTPEIVWDSVRSGEPIEPSESESEARIIPRLEIHTEESHYIYLREKKVLEPITLSYLRDPDPNTVGRAERTFLMEVNDLNTRFDNFAEHAIWNALTGKLKLEYPDIKIEQDYGFLDSHVPTIAVPWNHATIEQVLSDIRTWKRLVQRDGRVPANQVYTTTSIMTYLIDVFDRTNTDAAAELMPDRMKEEFHKKATMTGFMGMNWKDINLNYVLEQEPPIADNSLYLGNFKENDPIELVHGPVADDNAPDNFTGKFAHTWKEVDPSARQISLEWSMLPTILRPNQFVYVNSVIDN